MRQALVAVFDQLEIAADGSGREVTSLEAHGVQVADALLTPAARAA